ncbi:MAG: RecX family transcriptional regulator [Tannerella sp.]|jgi:regulatory protein|nr:RecX family transcriptional regulator [Tannerella sp.]
MKSESEILNALAKYCSQAERCLDDAQKKIRAENLSEDAEKRITNKLLQEKFIDEERFSRSFVNDKFKFNRWGRIKIIYELKKRNIKPEVSDKAIETIDEDEYLSVLTGLLRNKKRTTKGRSSQDVFQKLCRFASSRGFELPLIINILNNILKNTDNE